MITLNEASTDHRHFLYRIACDPVTRANALTTTPPSWSEHCAWFDRWMGLEARRWIVMDHDKALGLVWCAHGEHHATITVNLAPDSRGHGIGRMAIALATQDAIDVWRLPVVAKIRQQNLASRRAFENSGYRQMEEGPICTYAYGAVSECSS